MKCGTTEAVAANLFGIADYLKSENCYLKKSLTFVTTLNDYVNVQRQIKDSLKVLQSVETRLEEIERKLR